MDKDNQGETKLYRKRQAGTMAYKSIKEHLVYCAGGSSVGPALAPVGYFVILDDFGRSKIVLSPESFHKIYEAAEEENEG